MFSSTATADLQPKRKQTSPECKGRYQHECAMKTFCFQQPLKDESCPSTAYRPSHPSKTFHYIIPHAGKGSYQTRTRRDAERFRIRARYKRFCVIPQKEIWLLFLCRPWQPPAAASIEGPFNAVHQGREGLAIRGKCIRLYTKNHILH